MADDELKTLLPGETYTLKTGERVIVQPVPFGKLRVFSGAIASLLSRLSETGTSLKDIKDWRNLFDVAFEEIIGIMGLVLDKKREWFDTIALSDGIGLLELVIKQNIDEGTKKNISALTERVSTLLRTSSNSSSSRGTVGKKSRSSR